MMFPGFLGCGNKFRRALRREPLDTQQRMIAIRQRLEQGAVTQAYHLLDSTNADKSIKARMFEQISKLGNNEIAQQSKQKAIKLYEEAGEKERAKYLYFR